MSDLIAPRPLFSKELVLSYLFTLVAAATAIGGFFLLPRSIPLWYSLAIPEQQLVPKLFLGMFPGTMFAVCLTHTMIVNRLRSLDPIIVKIFSFGTTLVTFLLLVGLLHIVYLFL